MRCAKLCLGCLLAALASPAFGQANTTDADPPWHLWAAAGNLTELRRAVGQLEEAQGPAAVKAAMNSCYNNATRANWTGPCNWVGTCLTPQGEDDFCPTVLHAAAMARQPAVVIYLIRELGMDPNILDKANKTALHKVFESFTVY